MRIQVLMSTYNGERFIGEQLRSIYSQKGVDVDITVRDDGSTDATCAILDEEQSKGKLTWYADGENLRPARSFLRMLAQANEADLYAFSDQDDIWLDDKLATAAQAIGQETEPALYFCQTCLVDEQLRPLPQVPIRPKVTYGEALIYQFVGGCTMVMNEALRRIVNRHEPSFLYMHDVWIYDVALAVGARVVFDPTPHILYRQHGGNAVGQTASRLAQWKVRLARLKENGRIRLRNARELLQGYADLMPKANRELTQLLVAYPSSPRAKMRAMCNRNLWPADKTTAVISRLAMLTNTF